MSVLKLFKDFYFYLRETKQWKEEHWHFSKTSSTVHFGHKPHLFDFFMYVYSDKKTYIIDKKGSRKLSDEDWKWLFLHLKSHGCDNLFLFKDPDFSKNNFIKSVSTGPVSEKIKKLYDEVNLYKNDRYPTEDKTFLKLYIENKSYPVEIDFNWIDEGIILMDKKRHLNKTFYTTKEVRKYAKR